MGRCHVGGKRKGSREDTNWEKRDLRPSLEHTWRWPVWLVCQGIWPWPPSSFWDDIDSLGTGDSTRHRASMIHDASHLEAGGPMRIGHGWAESHLLLSVKYNVKGMRHTHLPYRWTQELVYPRENGRWEKKIRLLSFHLSVVQRILFSTIWLQGRCSFTGSLREEWAKGRGQKGASADSSCKKHWLQVMMIKTTLNYS